MNPFYNRIIPFLNKYKKKLYWVLPFPFILLFFLFYYQSPLYIITPQNKAQEQIIKLFSYTDSIHQGKSEIHIYKNTPYHLQYQYTLKEGYLYKFAYVAFIAPEQTFFDLSKYDYASITIKAEHGQRIQLVLNSYIDNYTQTDNTISYRISQTILNVNNQYQKITVPFKDFYTPDWWYTENHKQEIDFEQPNFLKVSDISFSNCINIDTDIRDTVDIVELKFGVNLIPFYTTSIILLICYYSIIVLILFKKKRKTEIYFKKQAEGTNTYFNPEEELLFNYLTTNYFQTDLSILDIQSNTGLNERKISFIIKDKTNLNFKQFINKLRIAEAKRLLAETDLQISEIAFKVGYASPSHFNRVFKTFEECSPNDFRKNKSTHLI